MPMTDETSIACTLKPDELERRLARLRRLTDRLLSHRRNGLALQLTFAADARDELEQVVVLERTCCAFLRFDLQCTASGVELLIQAPAEHAADARWLFEQLEPRADAQAARAGCGCKPGTCG